MGFFARLNWLITGKGEAPASYRAKPSSSRRKDSPKPRGQSGYRNDRNRDRTQRDRDREGRNARRPNRDSGPRLDRPNGNRADYNDRDRKPRDRNDRDRPHGNRRGGRYDNDRGRRPSRDNIIPRQITRPTSAPSSTMTPANISAEQVSVAPTPRSVNQGPEKIGVISNYSDDERCARVKIDKGTIRSGEWIEIQGNISTLRQKVEDLQLNGELVGQASDGQEVTIRVIRPVKSGDAVVRLRG